MPKINCIYLDMDGVIADFEKRYLKLYGVTPDSTRNKKEFGGFFDRFIEGQNFATLEMMPQANELLEFLRNAPVPTEILSSTARPDRHESISKQKEIWLNSHGITFKRNFVPGKQLKKEYAKEDTLIIDDTETVITDWRIAGGHAIWHRDVPNTLAMLKLYF
jgi:hypothetical protein